MVPAEFHTDADCPFDVSAPEDPHANTSLAPAGSAMFTSAQLSPSVVALSVNPGVLPAAGSNTLLDETSLHLVKVSRDGIFLILGSGNRLRMYSPLMPPTPIESGGQYEQREG